jgi:hypothetical protein
MDVHRVALLEAEQAAAGLHCRIEVGCRERQPWQAEGVCRVRFLSRDDPAARPLIATVVTGERDRADDPVAVDDGRPHLQGEPAVRLVLGCRERRAQRGM